MIAFLLRKCHVIPVKRNTKLIWQLFVLVLNLLKRGTFEDFSGRNKGKKWKKSQPKRGVALLAMKGNSPIVPISIAANYRIFGKNKIVILNPPVVLDSTLTYEEAMEQVMKIVNEGCKISMKLIVSKKAGYCFGVKRAMDRAEKLLENKQETNVVSLGALIHNKQATEKLEAKGLLN